MRRIFCDGRMSKARDQSLTGLESLITRVAELPAPAHGAVTIGILFGTFLFDCLTPLGIAAWAPYPVAIITAFWWKGRKAVVPVTLIAVALTVAGKFLSPVGNLEIGLINRTFGVGLLALVGMLCVRLDKREQALADALRAVELEDAQLRTVVQNSRSLMALAMPDGRMVAISGPMQVVCGQASSLLAMEWGNGKLAVAWTRVLAGDTVSGVDLKLPGVKDRVWDWTLSPIRDEQGTVDHLLFEAQDVSVRAKEADTRLAIYRSLFSAMAEGVLLTDEQFRILEWNPAMERMSGWSREDVLGQTPKVLKSGQHSADFYERLNQTILSGQTFSGEIINQRKDGKLVTVWESIVPILSEAGRPQYYLAVLVDLTERKLTEQKLLHVQKLEGLGVMAAGIAHDFNNLLAGMLGYAGLAQDRLGPGHPTRPHLEQVIKAAQKASILTNQMLAYAGKGRFLMELVALDRLIEDMVDLIRPSLSKKIEVVRRFAQALPPVHVDPAQIQQVIMNLCINAGDAIGDAVGTITLTVGGQDLTEEHIRKFFPGQTMRSGRYVVLEVADTGCGMSDEIQKKIFDPFFSTKATGRGLGLSAVYGIVTGHGGGVKVYSHVGSGTTFKILLPASEQTLRVPQSIGLDEAARGTESLLVIDDEEVIRDLATEVLQSAGYRVAQAKDGSEGVALYRTMADRIDLVILDMMMPAMNGVEVFREIRSINPHATVILTSGFNEVESTRALVTKGLAGFIQKPYTPRELTAKVRTVLDARRSRG